MEGENQKTIKYLLNQPATVHNYGKLSKSDSPRNHSSPTSILRKFPHSLRHDQKHQTKIKRNSSPVNVLISGIRVNRDEWEATRKSWSFGDQDVSDESEERPSSDGSGKFHEGYALQETRSKRKLSDTSISSDCSNDSEAWKPRSTSVVNTNSYKSVRNESGKHLENGRSPRLTAAVSSSGEKLSDSKDETTAGPASKLSVINTTSNECKIGDSVRGFTATKLSDFGEKLQFPVHKSTPNLLRCSVHPTDRQATDCDFFYGKPKARHASHRTLIRESDSLPHLDQRYRILNSILPKINRTISETPEGPANLRKSNLANLIKSESHINSQNLYNAGIRPRGPFFSLSNIFDVSGKADGERSDDETEGLTLIEGRRDGPIRGTPKDLKPRWSYKRTVDLMPNLRSLMGRRSTKGDNSSADVASTGASAPLVSAPFAKSDSFSSLNIPQIRYYDMADGDGSVKKCETVYALTSLIRSESQFRVEPMKPVNRLRVPPNGFSGSTSRMCSRCSSLLSMASSSRYSINTTGSGFVNCSSSVEKLSEPNLLCKLCLMEVPVSMSLKIHCCGCVFCKDCMRLYVEFEIQEGAYDISCPDAQCSRQGIVSIDEVETLVMSRMMERYRRFRLNHEVDMDRNRTWCPRAGCETVCNICPREKCAPTSVHCPTCDSDFCSNCKNAWHKGLTCEENSKKLAKEGRADFMEPGIPFDSDSIKCCPMCNVPIEKDEGCAQMMCKRCKHVFCWYCLASLDDDFLLRHYDKGPCKNKLGHTRASVIWHRTQVIGIFAGLGLLLLVASPLLLLAAPCIVCCKCRVCSGTKLDAEDDLAEESGT